MLEAVVDNLPHLSRVFIFGHTADIVRSKHDECHTRSFDSVFTVQRRFSGLAFGLVRPKWIEDTVGTHAEFRGGALAHHRSPIVRYGIRQKIIRPKFTAAVAHRR